MKIDRLDLVELRRELDRVETDLRRLRTRADDLEARLPAPATPEPAPIILATPKPVEESRPLPPIIPVENIEKSFAPEPQPEPEPIPTAAPVMAAATSEPAAKPASFEVRLGSYWFVRIGIVMVLTAMVFLGNYAYQHYIPRLGALGKLVLLYAASFGLLAVGSLLPRRQERLRNYSQVLFAGGLAAVYFTTYAAHHFPNLKVIQSALLDGLLLFGWTSYIVWLADRRKSEILAVFAIGLAYYTALITNVGSFTLVSNLLLASAGVFFLIRNRWIKLTFLSVAASYGTYFYWRYYAGSPEIDAPTARLAIIGYWVIFTAAVFLSRHAEFTGRRRAGFLSFNNGAAFTLLTASLYAEHSGNFWKLSLISGSIFLALAAAAWRFIKDDELPRRAYLAQGLFFITLGIITKLSGPTLSLVLAVESALLLIFSAQWRSRLLQYASIIVALIAGGSFLYALPNDVPAGWWKAAGFSGFLLFNAIWSARKRELSILPLPSFFAVLSLLSWTVAVFNLAEPSAVGPILMLSCFILTLAHYATRVREITYLAQGLALLSQLQTLVQTIDKSPVSALNPLFVIAASIFLALWWKRQQILATDPPLRLVLQLAGAFGAASITYAWLPLEVSENAWIATAGGLTLAWTAFAAITRSWPLAAAGQMFLLGVSFQTMTRFLDNHEPPWPFPILLILAFLALAVAGRLVRAPEETSKMLKPIAAIYQWLAAALTLACVIMYIEAPYRSLVLFVLFIGCLIAAWRGAKQVFEPGLMFASAGLGLWLMELHSFGANLQNLIALLLLGGAQWALRKNPGALNLREEAHQFWIALLAGALWLFVSRWVIFHSAGAHFYLTASWAALAFAIFLIGFALSERVYRWAALTILGAALTRVVFLDVWKLETIYRILSFLALGVVLLALGYIYTRYQEKIAKWL